MNDNAPQGHDVELPVGSHPAALEAPHFPDRLHAVVWRNWHLVEPDRIAATVGATANDICAIATSMGLPPAIVIPPEHRQWSYMTVLRRNWHLLPYEQLLILVDMTAEQLLFALREDFFLFAKLGGLKPKCEPVVYRVPDEVDRRGADSIKAIVERHFGASIAGPAEPRFEFVSHLARPDTGTPRRVPANNCSKGPRIVYSYFGVTGDPLLDAGMDSYPDGLLARFADLGVNGVWLHIVLRQLAPGGEDFPEFGEDHQQRLSNLRNLVERAKRYGIAVYLYLNEPRAMPPAFFADRPDMAGVPEASHVAMCTSSPRVRTWISDALEHVFTEVPGLGGVFTISASENLTHCASHFRKTDCPRCAERTDVEIVAELHQAIKQGVHRGNPAARVIVWDWGWNQHRDAPEFVAGLPDDVWLMSVSEWAAPVERGGVKTVVGEYALCVVGPGPRAKLHWQEAAKRNLKTVAKIQVGTAWELSTLPYLPVLDLVAEHRENLAREKVDGMFLSWAIGSYPSVNFQVTRRFDEQPNATAASVLDEVAADHYGSRAVPAARKAWTAFSDAFREFPYCQPVLYNAPMQVGPANLLYGKPTGFLATMVGIPYDDLESWRGVYPAQVLAEQFEKTAAGWAAGLPKLEEVLELADPGRRAAATEDLRVAQAARIYFASVGRQVRFVIARDAILSGEQAPADLEHCRADLLRILDAEIAAARQLFALAQADSRIGYATENQYVYVPFDLVEKVINCEHLRNTLN